MDRKARIAVITAVVLVALLVVSLALAGPKAKKQCNDKIDNDGDGDIDLADAGCDNKRDNDETNCGDAVCEGGETCSSCAGDCGVCPPVCGDGTCEGAEDCTTCSDDCGVCPPVCGDEVCEGGETCSSCSTDCGPCDTCSDTDGGYNLVVAGTASGDNGGSPYSYDDYCVDSSTLKEYYCSGTQPGNSNFACTGNFTGCSNGACY